MITANTFAGRRVAVFGLGRSGMATSQALAAGGADVLVWDDHASARDEAQAAGLTVEDLNAADWSKIDALVLSPGVPLTHPAPHWTVVRAQAAGAEVIGDIEIFVREREARAPTAPFIAITGTNGKSTTTALIAHLLRELGCDVQMGGNIGVPILDLAPPEPDRFYVVEMSSYQIDLSPSCRPSVGVLLNLSPDHIDRHGTFAHYAAVKARLVAEAARAVIGVDDAASAEIARGLLAARPSSDGAPGGKTVVPISVRQRLTDGYYLDGDRIYSARDGGRGVVADLDGLTTLRGRHNAQNVMAALAALEPFGFSPRDVAAGLTTFPGLEHRMQQVGRRRHVIFVNDSKATNADSTAVALASFERDIYWICGGRAKAGGIAGLAEYFPRIARAYLIGEAEEEFAATLEGKVAFARCGTLEIALAAAQRDAAASTAREAIVLLAPAAASFDQYRSFEMRGRHFIEIVEALPGFEPVGGP